MKKISVLMATYNGEKYVIEQLESIKNQSLKPDEVIISDDCSTDNTRSLISEYIKKHNLTNWSLIENHVNKGYKKNFIDSLKFVNGDIVFLSDQDDVWDKEKIRKMAIIKEQKKALAVFCLFDGIDSVGLKVIDRMEFVNRIKSFKQVKKISLCERIKHGRSPGLCLCFDSKIIPEISMIVEKYGLPHDLPIGLIAAAKNRFYMVNEKMVHHRYHNNNASKRQTETANIINSKSNQLESRKIKIEELRVLIDLYKRDISHKNLCQIKRALEINYQLYKYIKNDQYFKMFRILFVNNKYINKLLVLRNIISTIKG